MTPDGGSTTDYSLIRRLDNVDDKEAWQKFCESYFPMIFAWARRQQLTKDEAEDVAQDVLLGLVELYRKAAARETTSEFSGNADSTESRVLEPAARDARFDQFRGRFRSWLRTVTHHEVIDYWKKKHRRREKQNGESTFLRIVDHVLSRDPTDLSIRQLDRVVVCIKVRSALDEFVEWLKVNSNDPKRDITIVRLAFVEDRPYEQITGVTNTTGSHLRVLVYRLRRQFRDLFPGLDELLDDE